RRWLAAGPSLFAAALVAFNPFLIYFTGLLLTETLFTAMLAWSMVLLLGPGASWNQTVLWLAGGLLLSLSVLVRQSAIGLPVVLGVAAACVIRRQGGP